MKLKSLYVGAALVLFLACGGEEGDGAVFVAEGLEPAWMIKPDGDGLRPVGHGDVSGAVWSPTGEYLAYSGQSYNADDIYIYNLKTNEAFQVTNEYQARSTGAFLPTWARDGRSVAFNSNRGNGGIYRVTVNY